MKKILTTLTFIILTSVSLQAQIYRSGGMGGYGNSTRMSSGSGGSGGGGAEGWFMNLGGIYNALHSSDFETVGDFGGIGGLLEVGKGSHSLVAEYMTASVSNDLAKTTSTQIRAYLKRRQYFMEIFYLHAGAGIDNVSLEAKTKSTGTSDDISKTLFFMNFGLGLQFNISQKMGIFLESGFAAINEDGFGVSSSVSSSGTTSSGTLVFDGIKGGVNIRF